ncbi:MAG: hypothetical protein ABI874_09085, partial [Chloroflexota bacterium]
RSVGVCEGDDMAMTTVWQYHLTAKTLCLGERNKKGTYRASLISTIPYSQITGALRALFGAQEIHAVGRLTNDPQRPMLRQTLARGLRDAATGISKLPLEADFLVNVTGVVYIVNNAFTENLPLRFEARMGAFRSQGLGRCVLTRNADDKPLSVANGSEGRLAVRLPDDANTLRLFGISNVIAPVWGYLFRPDDIYEGGQYVRALFEDSRVSAPKFLLKQEA